MIIEPRFPAHLEVAGLVRAVEAAGGFAVVAAKGERDAGTILVLTIDKGENARIYERMPTATGQRSWRLTFTEDIENKQKTSEFLNRRRAQDPDLWIVELDIANGERFIGLSGTID